MSRRGGEGKYDEGEGRGEEKDKTGQEMRGWESGGDVLLICTSNNYLLCSFKQLYIIIHKQSCTL